MTAAYSRPTDRACIWRNLAIQTLETAGQPFRIVYSSESTAGIKAAIQSGLAVGVLGQASLERDMYVLEESWGFPPLPDSVLRLQRGEEDAPAIDAMAEAIERRFGRSS